MSYINSGDIHILGQSHIFLDLMDQVSLLAPLDRPVLVIGERGTGKELIASRLHYLSKRWGNAFIKLNCAALPETLLESELFGYEPGAFTGATQRRQGRFELAHEGSMFLDEVASMTHAAQEKLLRVIEYGQFERVGGSETLDVDVRVIGAANVDLPGLAEQGKFRADLLDRLAFDVLTVPPLRERREDIMELARFFANGIAQELEWDQFPGFTPRAEAVLYDHDWPGNVRELKNAVERAVYKSQRKKHPEDQITLDPFDSPWRLAAVKKTKAEAPSEASFKAPAIHARQPLDLKETLSALEKSLLGDALEVNRFNQRETAKHLSLTYDQLRHAMKKHGLH